MAHFCGDCLFSQAVAQFSSLCPVLDIAYLSYLKVAHSTTTITTKTQREKERERERKREK